VTAEAAEVTELVRRIFFFAALITLVLGLANSPAAAQSGRTFYIDYAGGSNANNGSQSAPWKSHPYMQTNTGCTGTGSVPAYSHQVGDQFIFKGGVTWPAGCFQLAVNSGGSSAAPDYYGVDLTWFSGGSFTRPVFDMANNTPAGYSFIKVRAQYIVFDNLELKRMKIISAIGECNDANMDLGTAASGNITVKNMYIHDWTITALTSGSTSHGTGAICQNQGGPVNADSVEMSDAGTTAPVPFGACFRNLTEIKNSKCNDTGEGEVGHFGPIHDNEFYNINGAAVQAYDSVNHTNIIETSKTGPSDSPIFNNLIHDTNAGVTIFDCMGATIYNNVMWHNANAQIMLDSNCSGASSSTTANIYNNTVDCSSGGYCFRIFYRSNGVPGVLNLKNNHWITSGVAACYNNTGAGCANVVAASVSNNVTMSSSTASSQGYTTANRYAPTSTAGATVKNALNLSVTCSGFLGSLCADRLHAPRLLLWDVGAYEFGSQSSAPNPPSNLNAIVQ